MKRKRYLYKVGGIALGVTIIVMLMGLIRRGADVRLSNGGLVRIAPPSIWSSRDDCKIIYHTGDGRTGTVVFLKEPILQPEVAQPAFIVPAADNNCLLILYDADVHYRLVRIDPTKPSNTFPENSYLNYIVKSSPWKVEEGTSNDWEEVHSYLKTVPQKLFSQQTLTTIDFGIARFHYGREELLSEVEREIYYSNHGYVY